MRPAGDCTEAFSRLVRRLDAVTSQPDPERICADLKHLLSETIGGSGADLLSTRCLQPAADHYARHLVHLDPAGRYSVLAMVWGSGQGTPLHDHAGVWCVECVYRGRIRVTSYDLVGQAAEELYSFKPVKEVIAGPGAAGALIPPFEYHTIENAFDETAVTLHVYGGEMTWCHAFVPASDGQYRRERRQLTYTD